MRTAPAERQLCELILRDRGWTTVKIPKNLMMAEPTDYLNIVHWCEDILGPGRLEPSRTTWLGDYDVWYSFGWYGYWSFHFKHSKDATAFSLKWI